MVVLDDAPDGQYDIWVGSYSAGDFVDGTLYITELDLGPTAANAEELDAYRDPYFGSAELRAGFTPDPYHAEITAGGSVDVEYLGGSCLGFAGRAPDFQLDWSGPSDELRIFFEADSDDDDPTLIVRAPDGSFVCNDDADESAALNPMLRLPNPPNGRYSIWVGTFDLGEYIDGRLSITELGGAPR
jgi:serine protease Do